MPSTSASTSTWTGDWNTILKRCSGISAFAVFILFLCSAPLMAQQSYSITDLGSLGGDDWGYAAISNNGMVTGASQRPTGFYRAFVWDKETGIREIPTPCSGPNTASFALGINSKGQVVGTCSRGTDSLGQSIDFIPFLYDPITGASQIPLPVDNCSAYPRGINESGTVTGDLYYDCSFMRGHGFRWDGAIHELLSLGGPFPQTGSYSAGFAINKNGVVVGFSTLPDAIHQRAVMWGPSGIQNLGTLGGDSGASGINDKQQVVGSFSTEDSGHAFIWDNNGMRDLGTLPGGVGSRANGINNSAQVVGAANSPNDPDNDHAFVWDGTNGMRDLNSLISPDPTWRLVEASGINESGQITGWGFHNGQQRVFLLTPGKEPLIFIPGISGSKLNEVGHDNIWPALFRNVTRLTLDPQEQQTNVFVPDVIRTASYLLGFVNFDIYLPLLKNLTEDEGYREYKVNNDPTRRTTAGCDLTQKHDDDPSENPNLFLFAYDWRKSNAENAALLKDYMGCVQLFYPNTKVNILTHSMGGLVARRYIIDNPGTHKVNKLVTIAAPWLGAPKAIHVLESGNFFNNFLDREFAKDMKKLVEFFPAAHQILPSRSYFTLGGHPFGESTWDYDKNGRLDATYDTYTKLAGALDRQHPRSNPGTIATQFHDKAGQDDWRSDQSGIQYFHIYGVQKLRRSIGKTVAISETVCESPGVNCKSVNTTTWEREYGDGTVPVLSAERIGNSLNLNAPGATKIPILSPSSKDDSAYEHSALTNNSTVWAAIQKALSPGQPEQARVQSTKSRASRLAHHRLSARSPFAPDDEPTQVEGEPGYYLRATGLDFISVADAFGNSNAPLDGILFTSHVPGVDYELDENAISIITPTDQFFTLTFRSIGQPVHLELLKGVGNSEPTQAIRYLDLNLPAGVLALLQITPTGIEDLRYDGDGDGTFETVVTPSANAIGTAALDTVAPEITFSESQQGGSRLVSITATDSGTGVKILRYSLDGAHFLAYTQPFLVDPAQTPSVLAFGEDNVANRSGIVSFTVPPISTTPLMTALGPAQLWIGLKNSDDVGTKFDLLAEVFKNNELIGSGQLNDVVGGSSGFNNARLQVINLALSNTPGFGAGDSLSIKLSVRIAASSGHRSGTARLWLNDASANSRFSATIGNTASSYFLRSGLALANTFGAGPKVTVDVLVDRAVGGNPFKPFGTWRVTF